jgi:hypothetical protein
VHDKNVAHIYINVACIYIALLLCPYFGWWKASFTDLARFGVVKVGSIVIFVMVEKITDQ